MLIKNLALRLATHRSFSLKSEGFLYEIRLQTSRKFEHRCRHFEQYSAARPRFRDVIPSKRFCPNGTLGYGCSWTIILSQTCSKLQNEYSEVDNRLEKNRFCWPCEGCQVSCRFFSFPPISSRTEWCHTNTAWLPRQFQNGGLRGRFFRHKFLQDSRHFRGRKISVSVKAECLLAIGEDKKIKLFGVTFSFKKSVNTASTCCVPNLQTSTFAMTWTLNVTNSLLIKFDFQVIWIGCLFNLTMHCCVSAIENWIRKCTLGVLGQGFIAENSCRNLHLSIY